jgi:uncharacterized protein with GYD domain
LTNSNEISFISKKGEIMKAYIMGNYTEKAFQGFLKDPTSDRTAVVEQLTKAMGGTMHSMDIVRGSVSRRRTMEIWKQVHTMRSCLV